jgi:hypothetical protein
MRTPLRKLLKQRTRAKWRALTSRRGAIVVLPRTRSWYWGWHWMLMKRGAQRKPPSKLRDDPEIW